MADVYGRAIRDWYRDRMAGPLLDRDGEVTREHPIERFYFDVVDPDDPFRQWWDGHVAGPVVDLGTGAGTDVLHWQDCHETVAIDVSEHLVAVMRDRGVRDARVGDMFALTEQFEPDRFRTASARGTQLGLAKSLAGVDAFLTDLAAVTTPDATAVLDAFDPTRPGATDLLGYRADPADGLAYRTYHFAYDGAVDETLLFRLLSPDRLREAAAGTPWRVTEVRYPHDTNPPYYAAALCKA
jgi:hypothetical protein